MGTKSRGTGRVSSMLAAVGLVCSMLVVAPAAGSTPTAAAAPEAILVSAGECTLNDAVAAANAGTTVGSCSNDSGTTLIQIVDDPVMTGFGGEAVGTAASPAPDGPTIGGAPTSLPSITTDIVIEGINNAGIYASTEEPASGVLPRLAHVAAGASLTLRHTSVAGFSINGDPSSGASCNSFGVCTVEPTPVAATAVFGGAIYAEGTLILDGVVVHDNEAIGGHSGFVEGDDGPLQLQYAPKSGADAVGGAIYATGVVTINNSVFHDNAVQGGTGRTGVGLAWWNFAGRPGLVERFDGGAGGDARGADIALSGSSTASIRSSVFAASNAVGGNGAFGTTTTAARNLTQPRAADGTDGTCDDTPTIDEASGGQGTDGVDGLAGSSGGSGGDALGVVHADGTLVLDGVIIRDTGATGGSAGVAGLPQLGGEGGDGGDALTCIDVNKSNPSISKIYEGTPGAGGDAGWSGHFAPNGVRAEAVAAVSAGFDADVTILNTTITATRAVLADDAVDTSFDRAELLRRLALQNPLLGLGGSDADGNRARDGVAGPPSDAVELNQGVSVGGVSVVSGAGGREVAFSTFADNSTTTLATGEWSGPPLNRLFAQPAGAQLPIDVRNVIIAPNNVGSDACDVTSLGANSLNAAATCFDAAPSDRIFPVSAGSAVEADLVDGSVVATDGFGQDWRMQTLPPRAAGPPFARAIDISPSPCAYGDGEQLTFDARGEERIGLCDAGAHELVPVITSVVLAPPADHVALPLFGWGGLRNDKTQELQLAYSGARRAADMTVNFTGLEGTLECGFPCDIVEILEPSGAVTHQARFQVDPTPDPDVRTYSFTVRATGVSPVEVTATMQPSGDPTATSTLTDTESFAVRYEAGFSVTEQGKPGRQSGDVQELQVVSRCADPFALTYEIRVIGPSQMPRMTFDTSPVGAATIVTGGGTLSLDPFGFHEWRPDQLDREGERAALQVDIVPSSFAVGAEVVPTIQYNVPTIPITAQLPVVESFDTRTIAPAPAFEVIFTGLDGIVENETRTVDVELRNNAAAGCGDVTGVTFDVGGGTYLDEAVGTLAGGASRSFSFDYTAPATKQGISLPFTVGFGRSDLVGGPYTDEFGFSIEAAPPVPTVSVDALQLDPSGDDVVDFDVVFDEVVTGFDSADIIVTGSAGADTAVVTGSGDTYDVAVTGMDRSGDVSIAVRAGAATGTVDNLSSAPSATVSVAHDLDGPITIVNRVSFGQFVLTTPIEFAVDFIEDPQDALTLDDLIITGSAVPSNFTITPQPPVFGPDSTSFVLSIGDVEGPGTVDVRIKPGATFDRFGNLSTVGTLQSNTVFYIEKPTAPLDVRAVALDGVVTVSWRPPASDGGLDLIDYDVEMSTDPTDATSWTTVAGGLDPIVITTDVPGLTNGVPVTFRVRTRNQVGASPHSALSETVTPNARPTVTIVPGVGQAGLTNTGPIVFDVLFDAPVTGFEPEDVRVVTFAGRPAVTITDAPAGPAGRAYTVSINGLGGAGSVAASIVDEAAVRASGQASTASLTASVDFDAIRPVAVIDLAPGQTADTTDHAVSFVVILTEPATTLTAADISVGGTLGGTISSLTPSAGGYVVDVVAGPGVGTVILGVVTGAVSDVAGNTSRTAVVNDTVDVFDVPGPPRSPASAAGDAVATVTWTSPGDDGGRTIDGYVVEQSVDGAAWVAAAGPDGTPFTVETAMTATGLTNGMPVRFRVSAVNAAGQGPASEVTDPLVPTAAPTVALALAPGQTDPVVAGPVKLIATFSQSVQGFEAAGVFVDGTALAGNVTVTGSGDTYEVAVSGMTQAGTVEVTVGNDVAVNTNGQGNLDSNTATVQFDPPDVEVPIISTPGPVAATPDPDAEPPVIANPGDQVHQLQSGASGPIAFTPPTATDNSGSVTVTCNPANGAIVAAGTVTVTCVATDSAGNSASVAFDVVVRAAQPGGVLPATGGGLLVGWALLMIASGIALVGIGRRRRGMWSRSQPSGNWSG